MVALIFLAAGTVKSRFDADHPRPDQIMYELDADRGAAAWVTGNAWLDACTAQFIPSSAPRNPAASRGISFTVPTYSASAPPVLIPPPDLDVLQRELEGDVQRLRLRLRSPRGAPLLMVTV